MSRPNSSFSLTPHISKLCGVCFPNISPNAPPHLHLHHLCPNYYHLSTGLHSWVASLVLFLLLRLLPTNFSTQATCCVMLLMCRLGHVSLLHKTIQCLLIALGNFPLGTLLSAFPSNLISSHSPLSCSKWPQLHSSVSGLGLVCCGWNTLLTELLMIGYFLSFRCQFKCCLFRELISGSQQSKCLINLN